MKNKINIAEILKNCPRGMELNCTCADNVVFDKIIEYEQIKCVIGKAREPFILDKYGRLLCICCPKCVIFPKDTTWEKFQRPFKNGDIVATTDGFWIGITTGGTSGRFIPTYCVMKIDGEFEVYLGEKEKWQFNRLATEEEKERLFRTIKENGYRWNAKTKTLEKLPKFKVGDRIKKNKDYISGIITNIYDDGSYKVEYQGGGVSYIYPEYQDEWELVPNKFDITTLKPFESRVLVRNCKDERWLPVIWGLYDDDDTEYPYNCSGFYYAQCIPYEGNEHLIGKTDDCDEYYKTWEK